MSDIFGVDEPEDIEDTDDDNDSVEDRLARLEYAVSRMTPTLPRSPVTNPIDDPDDPPVSGSWEGHPWHGVKV
jgi:hypothetical protein